MVSHFEENKILSNIEATRVITTPRLELSSQP